MKIVHSSFAIAFAAVSVLVGVSAQRHNVESTARRTKLPRRELGALAKHHKIYQQHVTKNGFTDKEVRSARISALREQKAAHRLSGAKYLDRKERKRDRRMSREEVREEKRAMSRTNGRPLSKLDYTNVRRSSNVLNAASGNFVGGKKRISLADLQMLKEHHRRAKRMSGGARDADDEDEDEAETHTVGRKRRTESQHTSKGFSDSKHPRMEGDRESRRAERHSTYSTHRNTHGRRLSEKSSTVPVGAHAGERLKLGSADLQAILQYGVMSAEERKQCQENKPTISLEERKAARAKCIEEEDVNKRFMCRMNTRRERCGFPTLTFEEIKSRAAAAK